MVDTPNNLLKKQYKCKYCDIKYSRLDHYNKHLSKCSNLYETKIKELKEEKDKIIEKKDKIIESQNKTYKSEITILQDELNNALQLINELRVNMKDTEIDYLKKVNSININYHNTNQQTNSINNITKYIINNYPNAPNIELPTNIEKYDSIYL